MKRILISVILILTLLVIAPVAIQGDEQLPTIIVSPAAPDQTVIADFQPGHNWAYTFGYGSAAADTSVFCRGTQSYRITTNGAYVQSHIESSLPSPLDLSDKVIRIIAKTDNPDNTNQGTRGFTLMLSSNGAWSSYVGYRGTNVARRLGGWITLSFTPADLQIKRNGADMTAITDIAFECQDNSLGPLNVWIQEISYHPFIREGAVSLTFDDGIMSAYTEAFPILNDAGMAGTAYINSSTAVKETGRNIDLAQLTEMQNDGWDIANHESVHYDLTSLPYSQVVANVVDCRDWLTDNGLNGGEYFSIPGGKYNEQVTSVFREYMVSTRVSGGDYNSLPPGDFQLIYSYPTTQYTTPAMISAAVNEAMEHNAWLVLMFHRFRTPATTGIDMTPATFQAVVDVIAASGIQIITVKNMVESLTTITNVTETSAVLQANVQTSDSENCIERGLSLIHI